MAPPERRHKGMKDEEGRNYIKRPKDQMKQAKDFAATHTTMETVKKHFDVADPESLLLNRKDVNNVKAQIAKEKRGGLPGANVMDELQIVQSQLQTKDYIESFIQRKGYAPCIILGNSFHFVYDTDFALLPGMITFKQSGWSGWLSNLSSF